MVKYFPRRNYKSTYNRKNTIAKTTNKPVVRQQRKKYVPKVVKNTQSIYTLAKQVKQLQVSKLGLYQKMYENISVPHNSGTYTHSNLTPYCFMLNNFIRTTSPNAGAPVYGINSGGATQTLANFQKYNPPSLSPVYNQWANAQDDTVSRVAYTPISATYKFSFDMNMTPSAKAFWIRIDFITPNKILNQTTVRSLALPNSLPGFGNLAVDLFDDKNYINPTYWKMIKKPIFLKFENTSDTQGATSGNPPTPNANRNIKRYASCHFSFPNKVIKLDMDDYATSGETVLSNMALKDQIWCVVSNSANAAIETKISRTIRFRDQHGVSA